MVNIFATCPICGQKYSMEFTEDQYNKLMEWIEGGSKGCIQDALPFLSPEQREMFLSRICPTCWSNEINEN